MVFLHIGMEKFTCFMDYDEIYNNGEKIFKKYIIDNAEFATYYKKWNETLREFRALFHQITPGKLRKLNDASLNNLFTRWNIFYSAEFWNIGSLPEVANWGGEQMLSRELKRYIKDDKKFNCAFEKLSAPEDFSFYQKEELDFLKIKLLPDKKTQDEKLEEHQKKYFWLLNSYHHTQVLQIDYFRKILQNITLTEARKKYEKLKNYTKNIMDGKNKIVAEFNLPREVLEISKKLSFCIWWQDLRKSYIFQANHIIDIFLKEISSRHKIAFDDLHHYNLREIERLVSEGKALSLKDIKKHKENFLAIYDGDKKKYLTGITAKKIIAPYFKTAEEIRDISTLKGITTSPGKISGKVKIIFSAKEIEKLKKGEILVTPMTSPDYIIGLKRAGAVITDHGGITCHAAIISRELGIPCIVGTKFATKILKDGDLVEVNANNGTVKKLK